MSFTSAGFFLFFPAVLIMFYLMPGRFRAAWLLAVSWCFYAMIVPRFVPVLAGYSVFTYGAGIVLEKDRTAGEKGNRLLLPACLTLLFTILLCFKYLPRGPFLVMPAGLSFFTFEAAGYLIDVSRGRKAEREFIHLALFLSFFPQLLSGPIARSESLLPQIEALRSGERENGLVSAASSLRSGFHLLLWGYFLKLVIADRAALFVDKIYSDFRNYPGTVVFAAAFLYVLQLYCDFFGYTTIAAGAAEMLGIRLQDNFDAPFFAVSFSDFWRRWHRSLTGWFRDYLYIPLGGGRGGKLKKYRNTLIVFLVSGIWHGNSLNFAVWGLINGILLVLSDMTREFRGRISKVIGLDGTAFSHHLLCSAVVLLEFTLGTVFFRAEGVGEAVSILAHMVRVPGIRAFQQSLFFAGGEAMPGARDMRILLLSAAVLAAADYAKFRGVKVRDWIFRQELWFRDAVLIAAPLIILFLGVWGEAFSSSSFVYVHF